MIASRSVFTDDSAREMRMRMKFGVGKRILMFFHWLLSLLICAAFAVYLIAPDFIMKYYTAVEQAVGINYVKIIGIAILAVYAVLAVIQIYLIFKRRKRSERGFITVDSSDSGRVRIAVSAIEQMVRQSVNNIDGITEMKIGIDNKDDAIVIGVRASILNGSHVPTITMNMQRAIRQFVEMNCGVAVREVSISINAVTNAAESTRHHRFGRGKSSGANAGFQPEPIQAQPDYTGYSANPEPEPEPPVTAPAVEPEPVRPPVQETPAFDLDKPYESEFAKDLAAMKARDAAQADDDDDYTDRDEAY